MECIPRLPRLDRGGGTELVLGGSQRSRPTASVGSEREADFRVPEEELTEVQGTPGQRGSGVLRVRNACKGTADDSPPESRRFGTQVTRADLSHYFQPCDTGPS